MNDQQRQNQILSNDLAVAFINRKAIPIEIYCEIYGDTVRAINDRLQKKIWKRGIHVIKPKGIKIRWVILDAVDQWVLESAEVA